MKDVPQGRAPEGSEPQAPEGREPEDQREIDFKAELDAAAEAGEQHTAPLDAAAADEVAASMKAEFERVLAQEERLAPSPSPAQRSKDAPDQEHIDVEWDQRAGQHTEAPGRYQDIESGPQLDEDITALRVRELENARAQGAYSGAAAPPPPPLFGSPANEPQEQRLGSNTRMIVVGAFAIGVVMGLGIAFLFGETGSPGAGARAGTAAGTAQPHLRLDDNLEGIARRLQGKGQTNR